MRNHAFTIEWVDGHAEREHADALVQLRTRIAVLEGDPKQVRITFAVLALLTTIHGATAQGRRKSNNDTS